MSKIKFYGIIVLAAVIMLLMAACGGIFPCIKCGGNGKDSACNGLGFKKDYQEKVSLCFDCVGSGKCQRCGGSGKTDLFLF